MSDPKDLSRDYRGVPYTSTTPHTASSGWHRHEWHVRENGHCILCRMDVPQSGGPVLVVPLDGLEETIARALWMRTNPRPPVWEVWPEWDRQEFLSQAHDVAQALADHGGSE